MKPPFAPLHVLGKSIVFDAPLFVAVCNVTPDSFFDGGMHLDVEKALAFCQAQMAAGACMIDVGGESTRPGAAFVDEDEEIRRVLPVVHELASLGVPVSIDTTKAAVARAALEAGACVVNDISAGLMEPGILEVASDHGAAVILGHMRGTPATMQQHISFVDVVREVADELLRRKEAAVAAGILPERILVDPGIGFGKTPGQCIRLLAASGFISRHCEAPLMVGASNKSFIGKLTGAPTEDRLPGTLAAALCAYSAGAHLFRVHDVAAHAQAFAIFRAIGSYDLSEEKVLPLAFLGKDIHHKDAPKV